MKIERQKFAKETDLCAAFISSAAPAWTMYPECGGFDILAVHRYGHQVGIEAKLKLNVEVVTQALPRWLRSDTERGPDYRAILVPSGGAVSGLETICEALGITILRMDRGGFGRSVDRFTPCLPEAPYSNNNGWAEWCPLERCRLPEYVPDVRAGASAPTKLTRWKIQAMRLAVLLEERPLTRADFKAANIDPRRWTGHWLRATPDGYVKTEHFPNFAAAHPRNYAEIRADRAKWDWTARAGG